MNIRVRGFHVVFCVLMTVARCRRRRCHSHTLAHSVVLDPAGSSSSTLGDGPLLCLHSRCWAQIPFVDSTGGAGGVIGRYNWDLMQPLD